MNLPGHRREYLRSKLRKEDLPEQPHRLLLTWISEAGEQGCSEPEAMHLSTSGTSGGISSRIVLLRKVIGDKLYFFTNYMSRKAKTIEENPQVALLFFWPGMERQVRIEGSIRKAPADLSDNYYHSRPEKSRLAAWASPQSRVIPNREELEKAFLLKDRDSSNYLNSRPPFWGGYEVAPVYYEFWQGRRSRLHDRLIYKSDGAKWATARLAP